MSASLQWLLIKDSSCYLTKSKKNGLVFSKEPNNLKNVNSFKYNGLIHRRTVNVSATKKGVAVTLKKIRSPRLHGSRLNRVDVNGQGRRVNRAVVHVLKPYRADLIRVARARASALLKSRSKHTRAIYKRVVPKLTKRLKKKSNTTTPAPAQ